MSKIKRTLLALALLAAVFAPLAPAASQVVQADDFGQWCPDDENC